MKHTCEMILIIAASVFVFGCSEDVGTEDPIQDAGADAMADNGSEQDAAITDADSGADARMRDVSSDTPRDSFRLITVASSEPTSCDLICAGESLECYTRELVGFREYVGLANYSDDSTTFLDCTQVPAAEVQSATLESIECSCQ